MRLRILFSLFLLSACTSVDDTGKPSCGDEVCNGVDDDCDGSVDEEATDASTYYLDADGDGYGGDDTVLACEAASGTAPNSDDCDDDAAATNPGAVESCNGADDDCDGDVDEDAGTTWYADLDGDGLGDPDSTETACDQPAGYAENADDCDDGDASVGTGLTWYADGDADGYGDPENILVGCEIVDGYVASGDDCDDGDRAVFPGAVETCDGIDNDCDLTVDFGLGVPAEYATVQEAVDAASDGDTICIAPGTWAGAVDLGGKSVSLDGYGGSAVTTIDAEGDGRALTIDGVVAVSITGLMLTGGLSASGAGLAVLDSDVTLEDVVVSDNSCVETNECLGALYLDTSSATLSDVDVSDNYVDLAGREIETYGTGASLVSSTVTWSGGSVSGNSATMDCTSSNAHSQAYGYGALYVSASNLTLDSIEIHDNDITNTGDNTAPIADFSVAVTTIYATGLYATGSTLIFNDLTIDDNHGTVAATSSYDGGATAEVQGPFRVNSSTLDWVGGSVSDNTGEGTAEYTANGYAIGVLASTVLTLEDVELYGNTTELSGTTGRCAGIYQSLGSLTLSRVDLRANEIACGGSTNGSTYGLLAFSSPAAPNLLTNVILAGNTLEGGYLVYGLIYNYNAWAGTLYLTNATVTANELSAPYAYTGVLYAGTSGEMDVVNSTFDDNSVTATSGSTGAYPASELYYVYDASTAFDFTYSNRWNNSATGTEEVYAGGGRASLDATNLTVDPEYTDASTADPTTWDLTLASGSGLIDAGDPAILDGDGSVGDVGGYGGPDGAW